MPTLISVPLFRISFIESIELRIESALRLFARMMTVMVTSTVGLRL